MMENHLEGSMDNIIVIQKIPKTSETYNKKWIFERLFELLVKHQAVVLNEKQDVQIIDDEDDAKFFSIMLFIDGFSHLREMDHEADEDDDTSKMLKLLHSDTDDEDQGEKKDDKIEEEPEEEEPTEWQCPICTFLNPTSCKNCTICGEGARPNM